MFDCEQCGVKTEVGMVIYISKPTMKKEVGFGYWRSQPYVLCKPCFHMKANVAYDLENFVMFSESGE